MGWRLRMGPRTARVVGLSMSVAVLAAMGAFGVVLNGASTRSVEDARRAEAARQLSDSAAALTRGLQQMSAELIRFTTTHPFRLDASDTAALKAFVQGSRYFRLGAAVLDSQAVPISLYTTARPPAATDPGYPVMTRTTPIPVPPGGGGQQIGLLSSVLTTGDRPAVAIYVVLPGTNGANAGLLALADLTAPAVREALAPHGGGPLGGLTVLDAAQRVVAAADPAQIGRPADPALAAGAAVATADPNRFAVPVRGAPGTGFARGGVPGSWALVGTATDAGLYGAAHRRGLLVNLSLLGLVVFAALVLTATALRADTVLRRSEERFRGLVQNATDVIAVVDPAGTVQYASPSFSGLLGYQADDVAGTNALAYVHPEDRRQVGGLFRAVLGEPGAARRAEYRVCRADGTHAWIDAHIANMLGSPVRGIVINGRDTTDSRQLRDRLREQAHLDALTGLANRRLLYDRLAELLADPDQQVAVLYLDLDRFKPVNDQLGHEAGDELLQLAAKRLRGCLRPDDTPARVGGDEFVIVVPNSGPDAASALAQRLVAVLEEPFTLGGTTVRLGASIGIGIGRAPDLPDELIGRADAAMYRAKQAGGGRTSAA